MVSRIEKTALSGATMDVTYNYTWLVNGVAAQVPYASLKAIREVDGVKQVIVAPTYEIFADAVVPFLTV